MFLDRDATVEKAIKLMEQAAEADADLIGFPETWIPGYPWWIWLGPPHWGMQFAARYRRSAVRRDGAEMRALCAAAKRCGLVSVFGYAELFGGSLYMGQTIVVAMAPCCCIAVSSSLRARSEWCSARGMAPG